MARIALYARVSTQLQEDEETIANQISEIKAAITKDGFSFEETLIYKDEGWSGAILQRPDLDRLRADAKERLIDILYVYDRGRLSRDFQHQLIILDELDKYQVTFKSLHDINGDTIEDKLAGNIMGLFHDYERKKISERFRIGKLTKVRNGELLGYQPPYGYDYIPITGKGKEKVNGRFVINEEEARVVRMMFEWIGNEGVSIKEVIRRLYEQGIPPKKGKNASWSSSTVHRTLSNETYITKHYYYKSESCETEHPYAKTVKKYTNRHTTKGSRKARPREDWLIVTVPRIIEDELFERVQKQIKSNGKFSRRCKKNPYLFGGLIHCPCGSNRTGEGQDGYFYYRCTDRLKQFPRPRTCFEPGINVQVLDAVGWKKLTELLTEPKLLDKQIARYKKEKRAALKSVNKKSELKSELDKLKVEENRLTLAYRKGLSEDVYFEQINEINRRRKALENELVQYQDDKTVILDEIDTAAIASPFKQYLENLPYEDKLTTVRKIVDKIVATKEKVTVYGNIPAYAIPNSRDKVNFNESDNQKNVIISKITDNEVGLDVKYRHCWTAERRQIDLV